MDQTSECGTSDSGIFSANGSNSSSHDGSSRRSSESMSVDEEASDQNSLRSFPDSGMSTPVEKGSNISTPVNAEVTIKTPIKLEDAHSGISTNGSIGSVPMWVDQNSRQSTIKSGIYTPMGIGSNISTPVNAEVTIKTPIKLEDAHSGISTNGSIGSVPMSAYGQGFDQNSRQSNIKSDTFTPTGKNNSFSTPVNAQELKTALRLQLFVSAQGGTPRPFSISPDDSVDQLIQESTRVCGLGSGTDVYLTCGTETFRRRENKKVKQTKLSDGSHLQLMTRCYGG